MVYSYFSANLIVEYRGHIYFVWRIKHAVLSMPCCITLLLYLHCVNIFVTRILIDLSFLSLYYRACSADTIHKQQPKSEWVHFNCRLHYKQAYYSRVSSQRWT